VSRIRNLLGYIFWALLGYVWASLRQFWVTRIPALIRAFLRSAFLVAVGLVAVVLLQRCPALLSVFPLPLVSQRCSTWTPLSSDPGAISSFLSSLAQFAAVAVTLALAIIVLVVQLQAGSLTTRAGALVINSPRFLFTATLLVIAPSYCIGLLGVIDTRVSVVSLLIRELAFAAVVPVALTFVFLALFTDTWLRAVSPAAFTGLALVQAVRGLQERNRDAANLGVRALGEALNNLARSADYTSLRLCVNQIGMFLDLYMRNFKADMPDAFFYYEWPERRYVGTWVEKEACAPVREAVDTMMGLRAPAQDINYLAERLVPFGQAAIENGDTAAVEVLGQNYIEMGATERPFGEVTNFYIAPLYESANLVLRNANRENRAESVMVVAATFFFLFTYLSFHTRGRTFTSSDHETFARQLKEAGIDFSEAARISRDRFEGYWRVRFPDDGRLEEQSSLEEISRL
jgi:hypothetical protein